MEKEKTIELTLKEVKGIIGLLGILKNSYEFNYDNGNEVSKYLISLNQRVQIRERN